MPTYIVNRNAQSNGDYEVHDETSGCRWLPANSNRVSLGFFFGCSDAVSAARAKGYSPANGCFFCARECHTG